MHPLLLEEIVTAMDGRVQSPPPQISISRIGTDSRAVQPGELFFALRGDRFDGHRYVSDALMSGAVAAVVSEPDLVSALSDSDGALRNRLLLVDDTTTALGRLGHYYRTQMPATVVAVGGSNGKTTTKAMVLAVLSAARRGRAAIKSFNNNVGVPLTLLSCEQSDEFLVVEIGTNAPGEVAALGKIAEPDIAIITSIGEEHLEFLVNAEGVAAEEVSLLGTVRPGGFAAVHVDMAEQATRAGRHLTRIFFGDDSSADLRAGDFATTPAGLRFKVNERFDYRLPIIGRHNALNALAAIAVGRRFAMEHDQIAAALATFVPPSMRLEMQSLAGVTLINDAYNANPSSVRAAIAAMDELTGGGRRVIILGDMRELGQHAERCHADVGRAAGRSTARLIIAVGRHADTVVAAARDVAVRGTDLHAFPSHDAARAALPDLLSEDDVILLKGSRGSAMEKLIDVLSPIRTKNDERRGELPALARPSDASPVRAKSAGPRKPRAAGKKP